MLGIFFVDKTLTTPLPFLFVKNIVNEPLANPIQCDLLFLWQFYFFFGDHYYQRLCEHAFKRSQKAILNIYTLTYT